VLYLAHPSADLCSVHESAAHLNLFLFKMAQSFPTLMRPPPLDPNKSQIEGVLELTQLGPIDPVSYRGSHS
jgi:hypothetical protein